MSSREKPVELTSKTGKVIREGGGEIILCQNT